MKKVFYLFTLIAICLCFVQCETDRIIIPEETHHEYIDLGLSVKWAAYNVGATTPEESGGYFAWGEIEEKSSYNWNTYKYCFGTGFNLTKYCFDSQYGLDGFVDNKLQLDLEDDAAHVNWGVPWRMPTRAEQDELRKNCTWQWTTQNGVNGYKVTGRNGNSIFLLAAGIVDDLVHSEPCGYYWSSSISTFGQSSYAQGLKFTSGATETLNISSDHGLTIRPVLP